MKRFTITARWLEDRNACDGAVDRFRERFPKGLEVTDDQEANFEILARYVGRPDVTWGDPPDDGGSDTAECLVQRDVAWVIRAMEGISSDFYAWTDGLDVWGAERGGLYLCAGVLAEGVAHLLAVE